MTNLNFDFLLLKEFIEENIDFLQGARLQKIQQPTRQELIFNMRNQGESKKFYININPKFFHVCFMETANEKKRMLEIPKQPPMFCMLLRKYLEGAKIAKVAQPENERILEFYFETYNELSEKIYLCLAIELMGKHSNVVLYNYDTNVIIGCMHNVGSEKSSVREIIGGLPYAYPPRTTNKFSGLSSLFTEQIKQGFSVNELIDSHFANFQQSEKIKSIKSRLSTLTKTKLKKINSALAKIEKQFKSSEKADSYRKKGDLIMANLGVNEVKNKEFSKSIDILDWETGSLLKIDMDETKTLKENANQYYKLYNKAKTAALKSQEMIENLQRDKDYFEQVLYSIEMAEVINDLMEISQELGGQPSPLGGEGRVRGNSKANMQNLLTIYHLPFTIYVGKNNKQNDYIVSKLARDDDMWFHTHNCAGSHVLLRVESGQKVTDEIIFECAKLAKEYSSAKDSSKVGVIYTKAKNLKKSPGANLGYVIYKNEKEIIVD